jgi:hypothetical protein
LLYPLFEIIGPFESGVPTTAPFKLQIPQASLNYATAKAGRLQGTVTICAI